MSLTHLLVLENEPTLWIRTDREVEDSSPYIFNEDGFTENAATLESKSKITCEKRIVESAVSGGERTWED